ncbi:MAG: PEP-CTERM sorting domain-containing protein [Gloeotrichia echinulata DEX184]|nr:PEP-CTERM sorting domain-containing protein [Gloeotrichia echinulata DEX184]
MLLGIKKSLFTAGATSLLSLGTLAIANPTYAASIDLSNWGTIGDTIVNNSQAAINSGTVNTALAGGGTGSIEDFLGISAGSLDPVGSTFGATQGSAIKKTFTSINAGDVFRFNWNFATSDTDSAFVTINNSVIPLTGSTPFSYSFATAGNYNIGIGVVDVEDTIGNSTLTVSDADLQAVPEPMTILGSAVALLFGTVMRLRLTK